uniref:NADH-ubiquinone oxidoreductase chain 5 n=1 Tax=Nepa hoffmanni TaxID=796936 RepID=A0A0U2I005_9HEMI|nr:NADH dehydrogenase subunit 5 [Nepa hoffmanni]ALG35806.1 NADH dehydrogenase subunit 5 [Nepa hoffmanni]
MRNFCLYMYFSIMLLIFSFILTFASLYFLYVDYSLMLDWEFLSINSCSMVMTFFMDWMSLMFSGAVFFISSMVVFYSSSYMSSDVYSIRFLFLVMMFVLSMFLMIMSPNMISILIGWDGLGLVSYCLVIYFQNYKSYNAGMLTLLTNRLGDVAILISIAWLMNYGSWHFMYYFFLLEGWSVYLVFLIILAGFTKSAQIPFSSWLPAAMAAPTPVSALVHSSTLVTAGVYLLIRFSNLFLFFNCQLLVLISLMTMFMAGLGACFEFDLKKIIALSTLSQLGLMMSILFLGLPLFSFYHLLTHAFFKALLFLCAGLIIHCMSDSQDIRHMGGVINYLPLTCACFCISNFALCGVPFLSGFYSKDLIVEFYSFEGMNLLFYLIYFVSIGLTSCYSMRLVYYCLSNGVSYYVCQSYSEDLSMNISMYTLTFMAIISGSFLGWLIFPVPGVVFLSFFMKFMSLIFVLLGFWLGYEVSEFNLGVLPFSNLYYSTSFFFGSMWFMPSMSTYFLYPLVFFWFYVIYTSMSTYFLYPLGYKLSMYLVNSMDSGWGEKVISNYSLIFYSKFSQVGGFYQLNSFKLFLGTFFLTVIIFVI